MSLLSFTSSVCFLARELYNFFRPERSEYLEREKESRLVLLLQGCEVLESVRLRPEKREARVDHRDVHRVELFLESVDRDRDAVVTRLRSTNPKAVDRKVGRLPLEVECHVSLVHKGPSRLHLMMNPRDRRVECADVEHHRQLKRERGSHAAQHSEHQKLVHSAGKLLM